MDNPIIFRHTAISRFVGGPADYLTGASNSRKRSRDSPVRTGQPLDDDAEVEDAGEK